MNELYSISRKHVNERPAYILGVSAELPLFIVNTLTIIVYRYRCLNFMPLQRTLGASDPAEQILSSPPLLEIWVLLYPGEDPVISVGDH
jgi:hypothetical protein